MGGLGYVFSAMEIAVIAFVMPIIRTHWSLSSVEIGLIGSSVLVGYFFGAFAAGSLGDLIGRRPVMMYALVIYCAAAFLSAIVNSWHLFILLRVVAGFGGGAEGAIVAPFLSEFAARHYRGRFIGALAGFFSFGFIAAALLGYFLVPAFANGWRAAIIVTAAPVVLLLWWRRALPESPRWLERQGRTTEAEDIVRSLELEYQRRCGTLPPMQHAAAPPIGSLGGGFFQNLTALWAARLSKITTMAWLLWVSITFAYYAFFIWIPSLLVQEGMTVTKSFGFSIAIYIAQVPGYYSASWLNDRIGRRATIIIYMILGGASASAMAFAHSSTSILIDGVLLSFFMNGSFAGVYAYTPEVYPTELRATGTGIASAIGRIGGIASPVLIGFLFPRYGFAGVFGMTTCVLLVGAFSVLFLGVDTKNRSLEEIAALEAGAENPQGLGHGIAGEAPSALGISSDTRID